MTFDCDDQHHLVCIPYTRENLHEMAAKLGIKRCWFSPKSYPHYDIPKRRIEEIMSNQLVTVVRPRINLQICKSGDIECLTKSA